MTRLLIALISLALVCTALGQTPNSKSASLHRTLIARAQEWVDTWNKRDVKRMRRLHADDASNQLYGIGEGFMPMDKLFAEIAKENFWGGSWSIKIVGPRVRTVGADAAVVAYRLVGTETNSGVSKPYANLITLVYQRTKAGWKVVHVHDSEIPKGK